MFQNKIHAGLQADCSVCTPDRKKKREKYAKPKRDGNTTVENTLRKQMAEEIGEDELSGDFKFSLMQKYGIISSKIDRKVTKPNWMEDSRWKVLKQEFHKMTTGLVPQVQVRKPVPNRQFRPNQPVSVKPWSSIKHKRDQSR